jgi:hypothetical protein
MKISMFYFAIIYMRIWLCMCMLFIQYLIDDYDANEYNH